MKKTIRAAARAAATCLLVLTRCGSEDKPPPAQPVPELECPPETEVILVKANPPTIVCLKEKVMEKVFPPPPPKIITITTTITTTVAVQPEPLLVVTPYVPQDGTVFVGQRPGLARLLVAAKHRDIYLRRLRKLQVPWGEWTLEQVKIMICPGGGFCLGLGNGVWNETDHTYDFPLRPLIIMEPNSVAVFSIVAKRAKATGFVRATLNPLTAFDAVNEQGNPIEVKSIDYFDWGWQFVSAVEAQIAPDAPLSEEPVSGEIAQTIGKVEVVNHSPTATVTAEGIGWRLINFDNRLVCHQADGCAVSLINDRGLILRTVEVRSGELLWFEGVFPFSYVTLRPGARLTLTFIADTRDAPADAMIMAEVNNVIWSEPDSGSHRFPRPFNLIVGRRVFRRPPNPPNS